MNTPIRRVPKLRSGRHLFGLGACLWLLHTPVVQAQVDLAGTYSQVVNQDTLAATEGPPFADYTGIPLNAEARAVALSHSGETISVLQRQCQPYSLHYLLQAAWGFRMWSTIDPDTGAVIAWNFNGSTDREPTTIWMDGRRPPSDQAMATPAGFTTGVWQGDTLVTTTTHLQDGYLTRNGVPASNKELLTMFFTKQGPLLQITGVIEDPLYLTEPYVISNVFSTEASGPGSGALTPCIPAEELPHVIDGFVPSYLTPQDNPSFTSMTTQYNIPQDAALGGGQTMYPEFARDLATRYKVPQAYCKHYCCGAGASNGFSTSPQALNCPQ